MLQKKLLVLVIGAYLLISFQMVGNRPFEGGIGTGYALEYYTENALAFAQKTKVLEQDLKDLSSDSATLRKAMGSLNGLSPTVQENRVFYGLLFQ